MNATIEQIERDISGNTQNVYPITLTEAVYDASGNTLQNILNDVAQQSTLIEVQETIGEPTSGQSETIFENFGDLNIIIDAINGDTIDGILGYYTDVYARQLQEIINGTNN